MKTILNKNSDGYGYKYTDLSEIHRYLETINSRYIQKIERIDEDDYIFTKRCFNGEWEEEWIQGSRVVQATLNGIKNPAQEQGSALTYARRYSLLMAYGLATDDDDAQSLSEPLTITPEEAKNYKLTFGRNQGKTIKEIQESDPKYIEWILNNSNDERILKVIELELGIKKPSEEEQIERIKLIANINDLAIEKDIDIEEIKEKFKVNDIKEMTTEQMKKCIIAMEKKN